MGQAKNIQSDKDELLDWYDAHRRVLPWRALPGETPDPYHVWLSEIMLQQTTVQAVIPYFLKFIQKWPSLFDLAAADRDEVLSDWAGLGYYARARNLHKCAGVIVDEWGGVFPRDQKSLLSLPGIGDYTSAAILTIAFNEPAVVVDGNIERVISRYFQIEELMPEAKKPIKDKAAMFFETEKERHGDLAQAFMDLGSSICTPKSPQCMLCPLREGCCAKSNEPAQYPRKKPKKAIPQKHGYVYIIKNERGVLIEKRPETGMLAGMMGFPTSEWVLEKEKIIHLECFDNKNLKYNSRHFISHVFTHFALKLYIIEIDAFKASIKGYQFITNAQLQKLGMPTLFQKVLKQAKILK